MHRRAGAGPAYRVMAALPIGSETALELYSSLSSARVDIDPSRIKKKTSTLLYRSRLE